MNTNDAREFEQVLARTVRELGEVQAGALRAKLPKPYQRPKAELEAALRALAGRGEIFRHPSAKTKFVAFDAPAAVRELALASLGAKAVTEAELKQQVAKKGARLRLGRATGPLTAKALRALVAEGVAFVHRAPPPPGESKRPAPKTLRYASVAQGPIDLGPYVRKAARDVRALAKRLAPFGVTVAGALRALAVELAGGAPGAPRREVSDAIAPPPTGAPGVNVTAPDGPPPPLAPTAPNGASGDRAADGASGDRAADGASGDRAADGAGGDEARLLRALDEVAAREPAGSLLLVERVRARAGLGKAPFDRAALALARAERVMLHFHDYPASVPPAEREQFVVDERGTYYIGIARRVQA